MPAEKVRMQQEQTSTLDAWMCQYLKKIPDFLEWKFKIKI